MNEAIDLSNRFRDLHVVVTGGATGIGRAIASRLASEGARISLIARNRERLEEAAGELSREHSTKMVTRDCDIQDRNRVEEVMAELSDAQGPLFALVANAGVGGPNRPGAQDRFDELVGINLTGTYSCVRAAQAHLLPGPDARHLVLVSSILARIGVPGYSGYCASKAGLLGLARALAAELAVENIQVNAVCPGWVDTDMAWEGIEGMARDMGKTRDEAYESAMAAVPLRRMSQPRDVAGLVAWLLSPDARGVTGQALDMNNGAFMG